jgi:hypothetical protein
VIQAPADRVGFHALVRRELVDLKPGCRPRDAIAEGALGAAWGWTVSNTIAAGLALLASRLPDVVDRSR